MAGAGDAFWSWSVREDHGTTSLAEGLSHVREFVVRRAVQYTYIDDRSVFFSLLSIMCLCKCNANHLHLPALQ